VDNNEGFLKRPKSAKIHIAFLFFMW